MNLENVRRVEPVFDLTVRCLCKKPYPGHPKGCPNWGKRDTCPPRAALLWDLIQEEEPVFVVWNKFDLAAHVSRMKKKHPDWTYRQLSNLLYWQSKARKELGYLLHRARIVIARESGWMPFTLNTPEANGVNVSATMEKVGEILEWPPKQWAYQVAVLGRPVEVPERQQGVLPFF